MRESHLEIPSSEFHSADVFRSRERAAPTNAASRERRSAQISKAALLYFGVVFGTGFVLETIRVLWSVPRSGERNAELLEQPPMLIAIVLAARWTVRLSGSQLKSVEHLAIGTIAVTLLVLRSYS